MADINKVIVIDVEDKATQDLTNIESKLKSIDTTTQDLTDTQKKNTQGVLENGGAMGILNALTGGYAQVVKDSVEASSLFNKESKVGMAVQAGYATVVGTSTGAMKAFRIALAATGIGLIVVALGLLIANFDKVTAAVQSGIDKFKGLGEGTKLLISVLFPIVGIIRLITAALEEMGVIDDDVTKAAKKNAEERIKSLNKDKISIEEKYNTEIRLAKAAGKDTVELEKQKRAAILLTLKALNDAERARVMSGEATEDEIKRWNDRQKEIKKVIEDGKVAEIEAETKKNNELKAIAQKNEDDKNNRQEKANAERIKKQEKADADEKKRQDDILKLNEGYSKQIEDLDANTDDKKLKLERERAEAELKNLDATEDQKLKLKELYDRKEEDLLKAKQDRIAAIEDEYKNKSRELNAVTDEEKLQLELTKQKEEEARKIAELEKEGATEEQKKAIKDYYIDLANQTQSDYNQKRAEDETALNDLLIEQELNFQEVKRNVLDNGLELLSQFAGKNKAIAIGILAVQKGLAIADIVTKASSSIAGAVASTGAANTATKAFYAPFGPAGAAAAGAQIGINTGLLAKTIAATKISAGINIASILGSTITSMKSNIGGGSAVAGGGAGGGGAVQPQAEFNIVGQSSTNQLAETIAGQQQQPVEAFVVGSSVTSQQELDRNRIQNSTFI